MSDGSTDFLYPMIDGEDEDAGPEELLADLARSARSKTATSAALTATSTDRLDAALDAASDAMAERFAAGGRLFTCGNGGSATDAEGVAAMFAVPPGGGRALPARSLVADVSVLTALANDIGFEVVYRRQLIAHAREGDIVVGFSTSGNSANVIAAFEHGAEAGLLTIGFAGYEGGAMAACDALQHCLVVRAESVHRIQEAQSALAHELWSRVQQRLG